MSLPSYSGERRKNHRFDLHLSGLLRPLGDSWAVGTTVNVGAAGVFLVCNRSLPLNDTVEYVLTFPPELTKSPQPRRVLFVGMVLRCERVPECNGAFGVAVRNDSYRYLTLDQAATFDTIGQTLSPLSSRAATIQSRENDTK